MSSKEESSKSSLQEFLESSGVLSFFLISAFASYLTSPLFSTERFFDLTIGNYILANFSLPKTDIWTNYGAGQVWVSHSWLYQLMLSLLEQKFSTVGLAFLKLFSILYFLFSLARAYTANAKSQFLGVFFALLVAAGILHQAKLSADIFAWCFFTVFIGAAFRELKLTKRSLFSLFLVSLIYLNFHHSFFLTAFLFLFLSYSRLKKKVLPIALVFVAALLCSPYLLSSSFVLLRQFVFEFRAELLYQLSPATIFDFRVSFLILLWVVLGVFLFHQRSLLSAREAVVGIILTILSLAISSYAPYALVFLGLLITKALGSVEFEKLGNLADGLLRLRSFLSSKLFPAEGIIWLCVVAIILYSNSLYHRPEIEVILPRAAATVFLEKREGSRLLNHPQDGDYLIYRFADNKGLPAQLAQYDSRYLAFERDNVKDIQDIFLLKGDWRQAFSKLDIDTVLIEEKWPLFSWLKEHPTWDMVHLNEQEDSSSKQSIARDSWAVFSKIKNEEK